MITVGSVCSGIGAPETAWHVLGWRSVWAAEIEAFPSAVLAHHWPDMPNHGDMTRLPDMVANDNIPAPDVLVGGTPCQAFSVAGARRSLDDDRGQLTLSFVRLADEIDRRRAAAGLGGSVVVWENVPGVLSTRDNAFGCFLAGLAGEDQPLFPAGARWSNAGAVYGPARAIAWRVLDAQYFGVAQRRRRVFVVASSRDGFDPATVLFEFDGVRRDSAPRRETGQGAAADARGGAAGGGGWPADVASTLNAAFGSKQGLEDQHINGGAPLFVPAVTNALTSHNGQRNEVSEMIRSLIAERAAPAVLQPQNDNAPTIAFSSKDHGADAQDDLSPTLRAGGHSGSHANAGVPPAVTVAFHHNAQASQLPGIGRDTSISDSLTRSQQAAVALPMAVRRLTPRECERLQGFPDDHTLVPHRGKPAADGPRYKALGNSMAVPVMRWIGERIDRALRAPGGAS